MRSFKHCANARLQMEDCGTGGKSRNVNFVRSSPFPEPPPKFGQERTPQPRILVEHRTAQSACSRNAALFKIRLVSARVGKWRIAGRAAEPRSWSSVLEVAQAPKPPTKEGPKAEVSVEPAARRRTRGRSRTCAKKTVYTSRFVRVILAQGPC